jgi:hypothetical protein
MALPARRKATYADLVALPDHLVGEWVDGELTVSPRPTPLHARATTRLSYELAGPFELDPRVQTLEVFRLERHAWRLVKTFTQNARARAEPFQAMEIELAGLWAR